AHSLTADCGEMPFGAKQMRWRDKLLDFDAFVERGAHLFFLRGHFGAGAAVEDAYLAGARPQRRARGVQGGAAPADDGDLATDARLRLQIVLLEEGGRRDNAPQVLTRYAQALAALGADGDQHGVILLLKLIERDIPANGRTEMERHP